MTVGSEHVAVTVGMVSKIGVGECMYPSVSVKRTRNQLYFAAWLLVS